MSLLIVVGDCFAANPPHEHQTTATGAYMNYNFLGTPGKGKKN